ncbi:MAG: acetyl-CoA carboxylase carboxyl transferase subunit beta [Dehalococcoidia bacterium]|nr:acetyl-CoA carboxylase carboxyl transferase subunit beta [Dehalococcoidia bacterium]
MRNLSEYLVHLLRRGTTLDRSYLSVLRDHCLVCEEVISEAPLYLKYRLCPYCRFHYSLTARERIELLVNKGSFRETNRSIASLYPLSFSSRGSYTNRLSQAQTRTGLTEAAITGGCTIADSHAMIVVLDFGFMGGSMSSVVGEKVALAFESAAKREYPLVALVSGGGARIQEGVLSLMQMAKTVAAANRLKDKNVPFIVVLSNPATGQAYASFANLADLIFAEPGSLIGLAPMKTLREASRRPLPLDAHTAEAHLEHGLLDSVVDREELRAKLCTVLDILGPQRSSRTDGKRSVKLTTADGANRGAEADQAVKIAKNPARPSSLMYILSIIEVFIELRGDRVSGDDRSIVGGLGYLNGERVVIIGQEREVCDTGGLYHTYPEGLRKARRLIGLAARFKLPVITLIDTQGAHPGLESEEQVVVNAIATTLSLMAEVPVPIVSVIVGEGGSEGALALGKADAVLMQQYAIYSPISPGQTASRLYRNPSSRREDVQVPVLTAHDCKELGIIDEVVREPEGGAHNNLHEAALELQLALARQFAALGRISSKKLVKNRYKKFRNMGEYTSHSKAAVRREVSLLEHIVLKDQADKKGKPRKKAEEELAER